jgi:hypothetical protein
LRKKAAQPISADQLSALFYGDSGAPPGEEEFLDLLYALESPDQDGRRKFLTKLPPECRALLLACAWR